MAGPSTIPIIPFWGIIAGAVYGGIFYWGMDQVNVQRALGAATWTRPLGRHVRRAAEAHAGLHLRPARRDRLRLVSRLERAGVQETFVLLLNNLLPSGVRGLVLAALLAALISSLLAMMNSISTMAVRDFILYFRPDVGERTQVRLGRLCVFVAAMAGAAAAYLISKSQEGLYKYLQRSRSTCACRWCPAIFFAIVSRRMNMTGAVWSVLVGGLISTLYVIDGVFPDFGRAKFGFLHRTLTENYTFRGLWEVLIVTPVLFVASYASQPPSAEKVQGADGRLACPGEPFRGWPTGDFSGDYCWL